MKIIISHPTGNSNVRAALNGLLRADLLSEFHTTVASFQNNIFGKLSELSFLSEFKRRQFISELEPFTRMHPSMELARILAGKFNLPSLTAHDKGLFSVDKIYQNLDLQVAKVIRSDRKKLNAVYAYDDGAINSFNAAKKKNIKCIFELPTGYWRSVKKILEQERIDNPEWSCTIKGFKDSEMKLQRKDDELRLADKILVANSFARKTLENYPGELKNVQVISYGFPPVFAERTYINYDNRPLKLLFVGGLTQGKGLANVLEAVEKLGNHVSLTIVGRKSTDECKPLNIGLEKHKWIPSLPHHKILEIMRENDVLLFPSLFEGFGMVITEAMSQGTPVITTERTAGIDIIQNHKNGWIVEASSTQSIYKLLSELLNKPEVIQKIGFAAMDTASKRPWLNYSSELSENLIKFLTAN